jgi:hypothetical protein
MDEFNASPQIPESKIDSLRAEFDSLLERMQGPDARKAMEDVFNASPEQLGKAALAAARKRG